MAGKLNAFQMAAWMEQHYGEAVAKEFLWKQRKPLEELFDLLQTSLSEMAENAKKLQLTAAQYCLIDLMKQLSDFPEE